MQRTTLKNICLKQGTEVTKVAYNQQRNKCVSILKKSKRSSFENLDVKSVKDNNNFWKKISPQLSSTTESKEIFTLVENDEILSSDIEVPGNFQISLLILSKNLIYKEMFPKTTQDIPVLACIKKITKHLSIVSIKNLMQTTSSKSLLNLKVERNFLQKS